jgi:branched-chain amino acid transport system substrate-binding protein
MKQTGKVFFTLVLIVGFGLSIYMSPVGAAEKGPIKIGFVAPQAGNFAQFGMDMVSGTKLLLEKYNYTVAGRKIELIVEDEGPGPDTAVTKVRKLIKHDNVHLIAGVQQAASAYAAAAVCTELETPLVITLAAGDDITQRKSSKYVNRISMTGGDVGHVAGDYAYKELGWRKVAIIGMDYAWGHECAGGFQNVFEGLGGKVLQKMWTPIATMDFGPYVSNIDSEVDGVWDVITGAASVRFIKSMRDSGIMTKIGLMGAGTVTDETVLAALGDTALGVITDINYSGALNNPKNKEFNELCQKKLGKPGSWCLGGSWVAAEWILQAIKDINGDVENKDKFSKALRAVKMEDSLRGPIRMDSYGHPIQNYFVRKVEKVDGGWGGYQNTVIKTYPQVSQFWTWDARTYLSRPVYSRDYPPCKFCK